MSLSAPNAQLLAGALRFPSATASFSESGAMSFSELVSRAESLIPEFTQSEGAVAIWATNSTATLVSIVACLLSSKPWIALGASWPIQRANELLAGLTVMAVVADSDFFATKADSTAIAVKKLIAIGDFGFKFLREGEPSTGVGWQPQCGCVYFTSGSSGVPKAVPISAVNLLAFSHSIRAQFELVPGRRLSLLHELSSSASLQNIVMALGSGAALVQFESRNVLQIVSKLQTACVDFVHIVPSAIRILARLRLLSANSLPLVRDTTIGGEIVRKAVIDAWHHAAPQAAIFNSYGPTEGTVNIALRKCFPDLLSARWIDAIAPIGSVFEGQAERLVNAALQPVPNGEMGELLISGSQVVSGYCGSAKTDNDRFIELVETGGNPVIWYRTGDLAVRDLENGLTVLGRSDRQWKINGYRVEPAEIEAVLRNFCEEGAEVAVIALFDQHGGFERLVAFVEATSVTSHQLLAHCRERLPDYMVPQSIKICQSLPLNANGKIDYRALLDISRESLPSPNRKL